MPSTRCKRGAEPPAPSGQPSDVPEEDGESCNVCMSRPCTMRFRPCGHAVCCELCTIKACEPVQQRLQCPTCRVEVARLERLPAHDGSGAPRRKRMKAYDAASEPGAQSYESVQAFLQAMIDPVSDAARAALNRWGAEEEEARESSEDEEEER